MICDCANNFHSVHRKLREHDSAKIHIQLTIALFCLLLVFLVGIERDENEIVCTAMSALIHYFTLAAVFWMGAEAWQLYLKLIIVYGRLRLVIISLICWCKFLCYKGFSCKCLLLTELYIRMVQNFNLALPLESCYYFLTFKSV